MKTRSHLGNDVRTLFAVSPLLGDLGVEGDGAINFKYTPISSNPTAALGIIVIIIKGVWIAICTCASSARSRRSVSIPFFQFEAVPELT